MLGKKETYGRISSSLSLGLVEVRKGDLLHSTATSNSAASCPTFWKVSDSSLPSALQDSKVRQYNCIYTRARFIEHKFVAGGKDGHQ